MRKSLDETLCPGWSEAFQQNEYRHALLVRRRGLVRSRYRVLVDTSSQGLEAIRHLQPPGGCPL